MFGRLFVRKREIEAHQVALVAVSTALNINVGAGIPNSWPTFSELAADWDPSVRTTYKLDREQPYFQCFTIERCLDEVQCKHASLADSLFDAWIHYLKELPKEQDINGFDFSRYEARHEDYARIWSDGLQTVSDSEWVKNPLRHIATHLIENLCDGEAHLVIPITIATNAVVAPFREQMTKWIVAAE